MYVPVWADNVRHFVIVIALHLAFLVIRAQELVRVELLHLLLGTTLTVRPGYQTGIGSGRIAVVIQAVVGAMHQLEVIILYLYVTLMVTVHLKIG